MLVPPRIDIHVLTGAGEGIEVHGPVHGISREQAAEEHDFGDQESPHAQQGGFLLLLRRFEVMQQFRPVGVPVLEHFRLRLSQLPPPACPVRDTGKLPT